MFLGYLFGSCFAIIVPKFPQVWVIIVPKFGDVCPLWGIFVTNFRNLCPQLLDKIALTKTRQSAMLKYIPY
jgi:hypothetical protein